MDNRRAVCRNVYPHQLTAVVISTRAARFRAARVFAKYMRQIYAPGKTCAKIPRKLCRRR